MTDTPSGSPTQGAWTWEWSDWLRTICRCMPGRDAGRLIYLQLFFSDGFVLTMMGTPPLIHWEILMIPQKIARIELGHILGHIGYIGAIPDFQTDPDADQRLWRFPILGVPLNHPFWVGFSTINHRAIWDPLFMNDVLGPKVTWAVMLLDFSSRFPDLPEWHVTQNLHRRVCQFRSRFQRLIVLKGVQVTSFKHANSLHDFHLGRLSEFCGSFNTLQSFFPSSCLVLFG